MSVKHLTNKTWIREHLSRALTDRPCEVTVLGGERNIVRGRWPLIEGAELAEGTRVHVRYEASGRACGFFTLVSASEGETVLLDEPEELTVVKMAA